MDAGDDASALYAAAGVDLDAADSVQRYSRDWEALAVCSRSIR
jgi:hypothetical protein